MNRILKYTISFLLLIGSLFCNNKNYKKVKNFEQLVESVLEDTQFDDQEKVLDFLFKYGADNIEFINQNRLKLNISKNDTKRLLNLYMSSEEIEEKQVYNFHKEVINKRIKNNMIEKENENEEKKTELIKGKDLKSITFQENDEKQVFKLDNTSFSEEFCREEASLDFHKLKSLLKKMPTQKKLKITSDKFLSKFIVQTGCFPHKYNIACKYFDKNLTTQALEKNLIQYLSFTPNIADIIPKMFKKTGYVINNQNLKKNDFIILENDLPILKMIFSELTINNFENNFEILNYCINQFMKFNGMAPFFLKAFDSKIYIKEYNNPNKLKKELIICLSKDIPVIANYENGQHYVLICKVEKKGITYVDSDNKCYFRKWNKFLEESKIMTIFNENVIKSLINQNLEAISLFHSFEILLSKLICGYNMGNYSNYKNYQVGSSLIEMINELVLKFGFYNGKFKKEPNYILILPRTFN